MTKIEQFKALFPLKGRVTQEIIDEADIDDWQNCVGALTLSEALGENIQLVDKINWGNDRGFPKVDKETVILTTKEKYNMMGITKPVDVEFILA